MRAGRRALSPPHQPGPGFFCCFFFVLGISGLFSFYFFSFSLSLLEIYFHPECVTSGFNHPEDEIGAKGDEQKKLGNENKMLC